MASWNDLLNELNSQPDPQTKNTWLLNRFHQSLLDISAKRNNRNVIFYSSAFLQKPYANQMLLQLTHEEINAFMSVMFGMDWAKGLTLILHTPGGITNAAETIVAYLASKFEQIEVIVPTYAMSAGTMISLAADQIIMGRQSQLGPIDPQLPFGNRSVSARAIVDQFNRAKAEIKKDLKMAHIWAPILGTIGPAAIQEAQNALDYGERMVAEWLSKRMFKSERNALKKAKKTAKFFNDATQHKSHGRRIDRNEAKAHGVKITDLEDDQELQDHVLTAYHLVTIMFEQTIMTKSVFSHHNRAWIKNLPTTQNVP